MEIKPPSLEVLEKAKEMHGFAQELKNSTAFHWFLTQLQMKRNMAIKELSEPRVEILLRIEQGKLQCMNDLVEERNSKLVCPLLEGLAQQAKKLLPTE